MDGNVRPGDDSYRVSLCRPLSADDVQIHLPTATSRTGRKCDAEQRVEGDASDKMKSPMFE
jgi:hypothetical protein